MLRIAEIALVVAVNVSALAAEAPGKAVSLSNERRQGCKEAANRVVEEFRARGGDARFDQRDLRLVDLCNQAYAAEQVAIVASSTDAARGIVPTVRQRALESAGVIIAQLNERGGEAEYSPGDVRMVTNFKLAVAADLCLADYPGCPDEARLVLARFNQRGADADFSSDDLRTIQEFLQRNSGKKQGK